MVEVVGRYVQLKKGGANFMGLCPFHGEKSPSFSVSPTKQFYHCFGCGANGNAISFLMEHGGMTFIEAVQDLAQQTGLTIPEDGASPQDRERHKAMLAQQQSLTELLEQAARGYQKHLKTSPRAIAYLKGRGLSGEIARAFGLGYAPEGWRSLGDNVIETIINKSEKVKDLKTKAKDGELTDKEKKELTAEEKEYKSKRKLVQEKLIKFATRIPAFMYLTDFRENTLQDVITKLEPELFLTVTGLTVQDFHLLVRLKVFNTEQMNAAVFAFRRYEDASLRYTGILSHDGLTHYGLYDTVVAKD